MFYFKLDCLSKCKLKYFLHFHSHYLKLQCRTWCSQTISKRLPFPNKDCYKFHKNKNSFTQKWHKYTEFSFIPIDCAVDVQENRPRILWFALFYMYIHKTKKGMLINKNIKSKKTYKNQKIQCTAVSACCIQGWLNQPYSYWKNF
jgi:hypothetical protein